MAQAGATGGEKAAIEQLEKGLNPSRIAHDTFHTLY
jgi:hypothetical protein